MSKYIKSTSVYTKRSRSQNIKNGAIFERDWSTLEGQKIRFGKGKTPLWGQGNFLYTTSSISTSSRKSKSNDSFEEFTYEDVKDVKDVVNTVKVNDSSNDIRSFAYYGSCVDLVESSITHIISYFPGCIYGSGRMLEYPINSENFVIYDEEDKKYYKYSIEKEKDENDNDEGFKNIVSRDGKELYYLNNPFNIDILLSTVELSNTDNRLRYMCESYYDYEINNESIISYFVEGELDRCKDNDQWYNFRAFYEVNTDREAPIVITFETESGKKYEVYGWRMSSSFVFLTKEEDILIKPKQEIVDKYFDEINGFERLLLNRKSNPLFTNNFLTPIETDNGYKLVNRRYCWPIFLFGDYFCIDIETPSYDEFVEGLLKIATVYDEQYSDNLYNRMTHEAIKNFDWTYKKEYIEGEEENNVEGGLQMQRILRLFGRVFDDIKVYADGIKNNNKVTYDYHKNVPDAILSDKSELSGWDVTSTIVKDNSDSTQVISLEKSFLENNDIKWFTGVNNNTVDQATTDIDFMRRLTLSSKRIMSSKGTQESIDMVMGLFGFGRSDNEKENSDYSIIEKCYETTSLPYETNSSIIYQINQTRGILLDDSIDYENLPLTNVVLYNDDRTVKNRIIVPCYNSKTDYLHDLYFQSKGGWCKENKDGFIKYNETIPYLNVLSNINNLFDLSFQSLNKGDIYFVADITDYPTLFNNGKDPSHFFYLKDDAVTTSYPSQWGVITVDEYRNQTNDYAKKAKYLNDIISSKFGNNPHSGYGEYDEGNEFKQYMSKPFKYLMDNNYLNEKGNKMVEDNKIEFTITETDKGNKVDFESEYSNRNSYYLNSKIVEITNNIDNNLYRTYFRQVMLPYLLQVIPATTILILKNF